MRRLFRAELTVSYREFPRFYDDGLLVRALAVLKSQGHRGQKTGPVGDLPPRWARTNSRSVRRDTSCGGIREKNARGVASYGATGTGFVWCSFLILNKGRDLSQYIKKRSDVQASAPTFAK